MKTIIPDELIETTTVKAKDFSAMLFYTPDGQHVEIVGKPPHGCYHTIKQMGSSTQDLIIETWKSDGVEDESE